MVLDMGKAKERAAQAINQLSTTDGKSIKHFQQELSKVTPKEFAKLSDKLDSEKLAFIIKNAIPIGTHKQHPLIALRSSDISKSIDEKDITEYLTTQYIDKKGHPVEKEEGVLLLEYMNAKKLQFKVSGVKAGSTLNPLEMVMKSEKGIEAISKSNISATDILSFYKNEDSERNSAIQNIIVERAKSGEKFEEVLCQLIDTTNGKPKPSKEKLAFLQATYKICQSNRMKDPSSLKPEERKMVEHAQTVFEAILKYCVDHPRMTREVFKNQSTTKAMRFLGMPEALDVANIFFSLDFEKACKHIEQMKEITGGGKDRVFESFDPMPENLLSNDLSNLPETEAGFKGERTSAKDNSKSQNSSEHTLFRRSVSQSILNAIKKIFTSLIYSGTEIQRNSSVFKFLNGVKKHLQDDILPNISKDTASYSNVWYDVEHHTHEEQDLVNYQVYLEENELKRDKFLSIVAGWINFSVGTAKRDGIKQANNVYEKAFVNLVNEKNPVVYTKGFEGEKGIQDKEDKELTKFVRTPKNNFKLKGREQGKHAEALEAERKSEETNDKGEGKHR